MANSKTTKASYALAAQLITVKEIDAMAAFIRNFKQKYSSRKNNSRKKSK